MFSPISPFFFADVYDLFYLYASKGYVGQFCEGCAPGFRRVEINGGPTAACVPCTCNGHSPTCDVESGRCICDHNTEGDHCERCARGFIGDARTGRPDDCQPCPCPRGTACVMSKMNDREEIICTGCPIGYSIFFHFLIFHGVTKKTDVLVPISYILNECL